MKLFKRNPPQPEYTKMEWQDDLACSVIRKPCPECGDQPIRVMLTCHTYQSFDRWMACLGCSSAGDLYCPNEQCEWSYTWGLNKDNPRSPSNEQYRPDWLVGDWPY